VGIPVYHTIKYGYLNKGLVEKEEREEKKQGKGGSDALQRNDGEGKEKGTVEKYGNFEGPIPHLTVLGRHQVSHFLALYHTVL